MEFNELTDEQKALARSCETAEELVELAKREGIDLSDEQLMALSGGSVIEDWICASYTCSTHKAS